MDTKTCPTCSEPFGQRTKESRKAFAGRRYCSRRCFLHTRKRFAICPQCGIEYHASGSGPQRKKFCSGRCYHAFRVRENHPNWKGGGVRVAGGGYVRRVIYPEHPYYEMGRYHSPVSRDVLEHRLVMAEHLGRLLAKNETVHHINGDKTDNRIENLQLRLGRHGSNGKYRCVDCGSHNIESVPLD